MKPLFLLVPVHAQRPWQFLKLGIYTLPSSLVEKLSSFLRPVNFLFPHCIFSIRFTVRSSSDPGPHTVSMHRFSLPSTVRALQFFVGKL